MKAADFCKKLYVVSTGVVSALVFPACSHLMYYPSKLKFVDESKISSKHEDIFFTAEDGTKLHGKYFHNTLNKKPKAVLVFFHGNAENLTTHFMTLYWILDFQYDYFIFDYRGYGQSEGSPNPKGTFYDGKAAVRKMYDLHRSAAIVLFGQSIGGAVALSVAANLKNEIPYKMVVVDSTFHSYQAEARSVLSKSLITWLFQPLAWVVISDRYAPEDHIQEISPKPLLIMHGTDDHVVSEWLGKKVFDLAKEPKEFWEIKDGQHIDSFWRENGKYRKKFIEKLENTLK